jgi:hypothetical protein
VREDAGTGALQQMPTHLLQLPRVHVAHLLRHLQRQAAPRAPSAARRQSGVLQPSLRCT